MFVFMRQLTTGATKKVLETDNTAELKIGDIYLKSALSSFNQETDIACTATLYVMKTGLNDRNSYSRLILFMLS